MKKKLKISNEGAIKVQSAIHTSFVNAYYLNEVKNVYIKNSNGIAVPVIKNKDKQNINRALESLIEIEKNLFTPLDNDAEGEKINDAFIDNLLDYTRVMIEGKSYYTFAELQTLQLAHAIDRDKIMNVAHEVIAENAEKSNK
jgi:hypothetical protein